MKPKNTNKTGSGADVSSNRLLACVKNELRQLDPNLEEYDEAYKAAAVMLVALSVGINQSKIAKVLGYPRCLIAKFAYNLKKSGVWKGRKTYANWDNKETGGVAFWMDVCVAQGLMERAR